MKRLEFEFRSETMKRLDYTVLDLLANKDKVIIKLFVKYFNKYSVVKLNYNEIELEPYLVRNKVDIMGQFLEL
jgi:hypothetical protein